MDWTNEVAIAKLFGLDTTVFCLRQQQGEIFLGSLAAVWRQVLYKRPDIWFKVVGNSMLPTFFAGDRVLVQPIIEIPKLGEVLVAEVDGRLVIHRVIVVDASLVVLQGDNSPKPDPPIRIEQVVGVVVEKDLRFRPRMATLYKHIFTWRQ
jgi:signal peptidase I